MSRFAEKYKNEVASALMQKFNYKSVMQIPKFNKIVINVGAGDAKENSKVIDKIIEEITLISGQKAVPTFARKSVANFKLREGMKIGVKVTLRGERMYEFMDRLFSFAILLNQASASGLRQVLPVQIKSTLFCIKSLF